MKSVDTCIRNHEADWRSLSELIDQTSSGNIKRISARRRDYPQEEGLKGKGDDSFRSLVFDILWSILYNTLHRWFRTLYPLCP